MSKAKLTLFHGRETLVFDDVEVTHVEQPLEFHQDVVDEKGDLTRKTFRTNLPFVLETVTEHSMNPTLFPYDISSSELNATVGG